MESSLPGENRPASQQLLVAAQLLAVLRTGCGCPGWAVVLTFSESECSVLDHQAQQYSKPSSSHRTDTYRPVPFLISNRRFSCGAKLQLPAPRHKSNWEGDRG
jgi:hypothetical protein